MQNGEFGDIYNELVLEESVRKPPTSVVLRTESTGNGFTTPVLAARMRDVTFTNAAT